MAAIVIAHPIRDHHSDESYFNLMHNFNIGLTLLAFYVCSFFIVLALCLFINQLARRIQFGESEKAKILKRIGLAVSSFGSFSMKRLSAIAVFVLFVHFFIWFTQLFLTNNIKTNKVVIDTSNLIVDERDIFKTKKVAYILNLNTQFDRWTLV